MKYNTHVDVLIVIVTARPFIPLQQTNNMNNLLKFVGR